MISELVSWNCVSKYIVSFWSYKRREMAPKSGRGKANKTKAEKKRKEEKGLIRFHFLLTKKFLYVFFVFCSFCFVSTSSIYVGNLIIESLFSFFLFYYIYSAYCSWHYCHHTIWYSSYSQGTDFLFLLFSSTILLYLCIY